MCVQGVEQTERFGWTFGAVARWLFGRAAALQERTCVRNPLELPYVLQWLHVHGFRPRCNMYGKQNSAVDAHAASQRNLHQSG